MAVSALYGSTRRSCKYYYCEENPDFSVEVTPKDITDEQKIADREHIMEGLPAQVMERELLERTALLRKIAEKLFAYNIMVFHGSVIAVDGEAYLFTAKSGTGKSTHTRLWRELFGDRAVMVNDDKPFLRVTDEGVMAYGSPWNGKHGLGNNICVPLKAICILERGEQNAIRSIPANEAVPMMLQQSNRPMQAKRLPKYMELIDKLSGKLAFYRLSCTIDPQAAVVAYEAMSGKRLEK